MIPIFFRDLSDLVRQRIAAGQAVHVTEQTAQELELLAGLPWNDAGYIEVGRGEKRIDWGDATVDTVSIERKAVTPADIALGWLLASKAMPSYGEIRYDTQCDRAAVCAELVALAGQVGRMPVVFVEPNDAMRQKYQDILRDFGSGAISIMTEPVEFIPGGGFPYDGTRDGARAAWAFICQEFERQTPPLGFPGNEQQLSRDARFREIRDTYRRELEAMK